MEAPQTPQSHSPAINSCATDLIPRPSVPKSQVEVGWGCILSCMRTCCRLYFIRIQPARIVTARLSRYTAHTAYTAIQPYTPYIIQRYTASLRWACDRQVACSSDPDDQASHRFARDLLDLIKQKPVSLDTTHSLPLPATLAAAALSYSRGELLVWCIL